MLQTILDWSEVWALLIPLAFLIKYPRQPKFFQPVIIYLWLALIIDIGIDMGYIFKERTPAFLYPNNYLYNIHSIVRFTCFSYFFIMLRQPFLKKITKWLPAICLVLIAINFIFFEDFVQRTVFSRRLLALEAGVLLFFCLQYYLNKLQQEDETLRRPSDFWMVTGLSIYVVFNFPFFLLYTSLKPDDQVFWWNAHNISFIILCIFIAKAFYAARHRY